MVDLLADALNVIKVHRRVGKNECKVPASKLVEAVLHIFQKEKYIGEFEFVDDGKSGYFVIRSLGPINECRVIKPRRFVKCPELIEQQKGYLPSKNFGVLILSTSNGVMTGKEAIKSNLGGRLLAYIY